MQISFKLGLRAQEIALLQMKEVARLNSSSTDFTLLEIMSPRAPESFNKVVKQIEALAKSNAEINPENFYPSLAICSFFTEPLKKRLDCMLPQSLSPQL